MRSRAPSWLVVCVLVAGLLAAVAASAVVGPAVQGSQLGTWNETYTPGPENGTFLDGVAAETGGYLLVGQFGPEDGDDNALAMKVDDAGGVEWVWSLQGYGNATLSAGVELDDGGYLVAGTRRTPEEGPRRFVAALTGDGRLAWRDTYGPGRIDDAVGVPDGGALLVGGDRATVITPSGAEIWSERYGDDRIEAAARLEDGYVLAGAATDGADPDRVVLRIGGTGGVEWRESRRVEGADTFTGAAVRNDAIYVAGTASSAEGSGDRTTVAVYRGDGTRESAQSYRGDAAGGATAVTGGPSGGVAAVSRDGSGRLVRFEAAGPGETVDLAVSPHAVTAIGDGRYLVAGTFGGEAYAGVLAPEFVRSGGLLSQGGAGSDEGESGGEDAGTAGDGSGGAATTDGGESGGAGTAGSDGGGLPSFSVGGLPTGLTRLLVAAALLASLVAVAVSVLAWRRL